jgi:hypothetical protein
MTVKTPLKTDDFVNLSLKSSPEQKLYRFENWNFPPNSTQFLHKKVKIILQVWFTELHQIMLTPIVHFDFSSGESTSKRDIRSNHRGKSQNFHQFRELEAKFDLARKHPEIKPELILKNSF